MESIKYINSKNEEIEFKKKPPILLQYLSGTGGIETDVQLQKSPFQDGQTYIDSILEPRILECELMIMVADEDELFETRRNISKVLNSKLGKGKLIYSFGNSEVKEIECVVDLAPVFLNGTDNRGTNWQKCILNFISPNPFWKDNLVSGEVMSVSIPNFILPFNITDSLEIETDGTNRVTIDNVGDVETPVKIIFNGPAINPIVTNETTGEFIKVNKTLLDNEQLIINTAFGNKEVLFYDGSTYSNAFGNIDLASTFWNLIVGENEISYSADFGIETANVLIQYQNRYVGV